MTVSVQKYPYGYVSALASDHRFVGSSYGNATVTELYRLMLSNKQNLTDWQYVNNVITIATRLIGKDWNTWAILQVPNNPYIYGVNRDFIEDTINYILTGKRKMPLGIWTELLVESPREKAKIERMGVTKPLNFLPNGTEYISQWLRHSDGLIDMILTLNILFGYTTKSTTEENEELKRSKK